MDVLGADDGPTAADAGRQMADAATRVRLMADAGKVEMTASQLLAIFGAEDTHQAREDVLDELYDVGLTCQPALEQVMPQDKVKVVPVGSPEGDHMLRNGIIWAIVLPIVGFVQAMRLFARERVGQGIAVLCVCIVTVLAWLYVAGVFDKPLSSVGLNFHECAKNGLGQTFCGKELDEARERAKRFEEQQAAEKQKLEKEQAAEKQKLSQEQREREAQLRVEERKSQEELRATERREGEEQANLQRESAAEQARLEEELRRNSGE